MEALTTSPEYYKKVKEHLQSYSDEQKFFLRQSIIFSQTNKAKNDWTKENDPNGSNNTLLAADAWLMGVLA